jgi:hypothetical protein
MKKPPKKVLTPVNPALGRSARTRLKALKDPDQHYTAYSIGYLRGAAIVVLLVRDDQNIRTSV